MSVLHRSSSDKLPDLMIYYINLSRRPDRNVTLLEELNNVQLHAQRIDAIDADTMTAEDMFFLSASEAACWLSHIKAIETFLTQSSSSVCLILEDDVKFDRSTNWVQFLHLAAAFIESQSFDLLQVGHLSPRYRFRITPSRLFEYYLSFRYRYRIVKSPLGKIRMNEFRVGAHAYLLSRQGAMKLLNTNKPPVHPTDGFFSFLADVQDGREKFKIGRLSKSLVRQYTRDNKLRPLDSDLSMH